MSLETIRTAKRNPHSYLTAELQNILNWKSSLNIKFVNYWRYKKIVELKKILETKKNNMKTRAMKVPLNPIVFK